LNLRRPVTFAACFGLASFLAIGPEAHAQGLSDVRYEVLAEDEQAIVDRIAADFYEKDLSAAQTEAIEGHTSAIYAAGSREERARMRAERRAEWRAMAEAERRALMDAKRPRYDNLTADQKAPFRAHAINRLRAADAIDEDALSAALREDI
jgi:hypothetical protein